MNVKFILKALNQRPIAFYPIYRDLANNSLPGGVVLSQLLYWDSVVEGNKFYKTDADIINETGITPAELRLVKKILKELPFIKVSREGLPPRTYYQIDHDLLAKAIEAQYEAALMKDKKDHGHGSGTPSNQDEVGQMAPSGKCDSSQVQSHKVASHSSNFAESAKLTKSQKNQQMGELHSSNFAESAKLTKSQKNQQMGGSPASNFAESAKLILLNQQNRFCGISKLHIINTENTAEITPESVWRADARAHTHTHAQEESAPSSLDAVSEQVDMSSLQSDNANGTMETAASSNRQLGKEDAAAYENTPQTKSDAAGDDFSRKTGVGSGLDEKTASDAFESVSAKKPASGGKRRGRKASDGTTYQGLKITDLPITPDQAKELIDYRKNTVKKPLTQRALNLLAKNIASAVELCGISADEVIDIIEVNGWRGCEPEWIANRLKRLNASSSQNQGHWQIHAGNQPASVQPQRAFTPAGRIAEALTGRDRMHDQVAAQGYAPAGYDPFDFGIDPSDHHIIEGEIISSDLSDDLFNLDGTSYGFEGVQ